MVELFGGIGGWAVAAQMAGGIDTIAYSEIDKKKIRIYEHRHPNVPNLGDIRNIHNPPSADIYTVSFPCTDISTAGKGGGIEGEHSRLWFEAERVIGHVRPKYIVVENSPVLTIRGFHRILAFFASIGYNAEWMCLQGTQFGIQQYRKRLFCIAYRNKIGSQQQCTGQIFRKVEAGWGGHSTQIIFPGWANRSCVPEPRTYRSAYDVPGGIYRVAGTGDAIIPLIGMYCLVCIKRHAEQN